MDSWLMSGHINQRVTTDEELWISYRTAEEGTAGICTDLLLPSCKYQGEGCRSVNSVSMMFWYLPRCMGQQHNDVDLICHLSRCLSQIITQITIRQNICTLRVCERSIKTQSEKSEQIKIKSRFNHSTRMFIMSYITSPVSQSVLLNLLFTKPHHLVT